MDLVESNGGGGSGDNNRLSVDNGPMLMAVTKKGRVVRGDSHLAEFFYLMHFLPQVAQGFVCIISCLAMSTQSNGPTTVSNDWG